MTESEERLKMLAWEQRKDKRNIREVLGIRLFCRPRPNYLDDLRTPKEMIDEWYQNQPDLSDFEEPEEPDPNRITRFPGVIGY